MATFSDLNALAEALREEKQQLLSWYKDQADKGDVTAKVIVHSEKYSQQWRNICDKGDVTAKVIVQKRVVQKRKEDAVDVKSSMVELGKNLTTELIPKALAQPNIGIPEPITRIVLGTLIVVLQLEQQNIINRKLKKLFGSYYQNGVRYLRAAENADGEQRRDWINQALDKFMTASSLEEDALLAAKSEFFVGVCFNLLNNSISAREAYEQAYRAASQLAVKWMYRPQQLAQLQPFMNTLSQVLRAHGSTLIP